MTEKQNLGHFPGIQVRNLLGKQNARRMLAPLNLEPPEVDELSIDNSSMTWKDRATFTFTANESLHGEFPWQGQCEVSINEGASFLDSAACALFVLERFSLETKDEKWFLNWTGKFDVEADTDAIGFLLVEGGLGYWDASGGYRTLHTKLECVITVSVSHNKTVCLDFQAETAKALVQGIRLIFDRLNK